MIVRLAAGIAPRMVACGGGKDGRGCGTNHIGHELWCSNAKLCFAISEETVLRATIANEDGVLN